MLQNVLNGFLDSVTTSDGIYYVSKRTKLRVSRVIRKIVLANIRYLLKSDAQCPCSAINVEFILVTSSPNPRFIIYASVPKFDINLNCDFERELLVFSRRDSQLKYTFSISLG